MSVVSVGTLIVPLFIGGMVAAFFYPRRDRSQIAAGILAGIGVGLLALVVTIAAGA